MQAQVSYLLDQNPILGRSTLHKTDSEFADMHKEIVQCKLKLPTRLRLVSFTRKL